MSNCCNAKTIIVQSRKGGFISQNCLKCGIPNNIDDRSLPDLDCAFCGKLLTVEIVDKNYFYTCKQCNKNWKIADNVPHWGDLFQYSGLPAPRNSLTS